jgi:hypothetical protein
MIYCPKCNGEMDLDATVCNACGYTFRSMEPEPERLGFFDSWWCDASLIVGEFICGLFSIGIFLSFIGGLIWSIFQSKFDLEMLRTALILPLAAMLFWAMVVVFHKVRNL